MNRVAILMCGGLSRKHNIKDYKNLNDDSYTKYDYVDYTKAYRSLKHHLINANPTYEFDFFLHGWDVDLEEKMIELYKPLVSVFESNEQYHEMFNQKIPNTHTNAYRNLSRAYSICKNIKAFLSYCKKHNIEYDRVIIYRYDGVLGVDMKMETYEKNTIYADTPPLNCQLVYGEWYLVVPPKDLEELQYIYDRSHLIVPNAHFWFNTFTQLYLKKNIISDPQIMGEYQIFSQRYIELGIYQQNEYGKSYLSMKDHIDSL